MPPKPQKPPPCSLTLITPPLSGASADACAKIFADVLAAVPIASALVRLAPGAEGDAKSILAPFLKIAVAANCALIVENDARLAARLGADGVHVAGVGDALDEALESLKPERIVGVGALRMRDEAMTAGEKGADYVMFGEPHGKTPAMALDLLVERVGWWAEIFETPCVAYAQSVEAAGQLARAGADFVALDSAIWDAASPADAARAARTALDRIAAEASL
jgi:thiamine-phosphate pyrophosphorylase